ncbi:MAG: hypothetical protein IJ072_00860 [Oscillospiraceae bacterium]|nr:hypothetical protein [Oscillospiraceae bacterium]
MNRYVKYVLGLMTMAAGVVLMKKAALGITPITSLPLALNEALPALSLGNWTILFHILCIVGIIIVRKKVELKTVLMLPVGIGFGYFIDLLLLIFSMETNSLPLRILLLILGIPVSGLGVALINDADLMLPSPDGLIRTVAGQYGLKYPIVKIVGDCTWVAIAVAIELSVLHRLTAVNVGTIASALLVGRAIKIWNQLLFAKDDKEKQRYT